MLRTGAEIGARALEVYRRLADSPVLAPGGLHVYDGHTNQPDADIRARQVAEVWTTVHAFVKSLEADGFAVPRIVVGGSGGFPAWARRAALEPRLECSPGTLILNDAGYRNKYADLDCFPAAVLLGRVVSKPATGLLTVDLGSKAVAPDSDPAVRVQLLNVPGAEILSQHEEHLVVRTPAAEETPLGFLVYAWPNHICPTVALHRELLVVENGEVVETWPVVARDRSLTV
jgi:D-serine deaminase-like pyridoxal phosphate-dependent protein